MAEKGLALRMGRRRTIWLRLCWPDRCPCAGYVVYLFEGDERKVRIEGP